MPARRMRATCDGLFHQVSTARMIAAAAASAVASTKTKPVPAPVLGSWSDTVSASPPVARTTGSVP